MQIQSQTPQLRTPEQQWLALFESRMCNLYQAALLFTGNTGLAETAVLDSLNLLDTANEPDETLAHKQMVRAVVITSKAIAQGNTLQFCVTQESAKSASIGSLHASW